MNLWQSVAKLRYLERVPFRDRRLASLTLVALCATGVGCATGYALAQRDNAEMQRSSPSLPVTWYGPVEPGDKAVLARWRAGVGPEVVRSAPTTYAAPADDITVVSWNVAIGAGDVERMASTLPRNAALVLLLQEVYRGGPEVPSLPPAGSEFAQRHGGARGGAHYKEIEAIGEALGLSVYYAPSMRNGRPASSDEDRGNAILTNLPLTDLSAIELPFERQRRVVVAGTISGRTARGAAWQMRVASAHLDNRAGMKRLYVGSEYGRVRQSRALASMFGAGPPTLLAGDFNTWFGFQDRGYLEIAKAFPQTRVTDRRATFLGVMRLDHMFVRLAPGWRAEFHRGNDRFGSDHSPLIGTVSFD